MRRERYIAGQWKKAALGILVLGVLMLVGCGSAASTNKAEEQSAEETVSEGEAEAPFQGIAAVYEPDSGIVNPPTVILRVTSALPEGSGRTPAVALMEIDENLNIIGDNGDMIASVDTFMDTCKRTVIPAFVIDSEAESTALSEYIFRNGIQDAFVVAAGEQAALVKKLRDTCTLTRGALLFDSLDTDEKRKEARRLVNDNKCFVAISEAPLDEYTATYFNARQIAAWSTADDEAGVYRAISNGYAGVIADDPAMIYDVYEGITETTVSGKPIVIAHRGGHLETPENTIMGFHGARDIYGAQAVETDIRVTADGVVFLMHDSKVDRTTDGTGKGSEMTWEQLEALVVDEKIDLGTDKLTKVPKLETVLEEFKDSDLVFYCHNKTNSSTETEIFCRLVEQYGFDDNVVFFNSFDDRNRYNLDNENMPDGIVFTAGDYPLVYAYAKDEQEAVGSFIKQLVPANYQPLFYSYGEKFATESFYYQMAARGFINSHSITNGQEVLNETLLTGMGAVGVLTDELFCGILQLDGPSLTAVDGGYTLTEEGEVTVVFYADRTAEGDATYRVYSEPVKIMFVSG